jgi:hypothetical protein
MGLKVGAFACCLIGLCQGVLIFQYYRSPENRPVGFRDFIGLIAGGANFFLTFAPAIMFYRFRGDSELQPRLRTIKAVEILVFAFFLASLIT